MFYVEKNNQLKIHQYFLRLFALIFIAVFSFEASGQTGNVSNDEYAIYSSILNAANKWTILNRKREFPSAGRGMNTIVIQNKTAFRFKAEDFEGVDCDESYKWRKLEPLFEAMFIRNRRTYPLHKRFSLTSRYELISEKTFHNFFPSPSPFLGYEAFHKKYGVRSAFYRISRAGFNARKTKALVYVFEECSAICAFGRFIQFNKIKGKWKVVEEFGC